MTLVCTEYAHAGINGGRTVCHLVVLWFLGGFKSLLGLKVCFQYNFGMC